MTTVFIISAPSGSGKSTLVNELMRRSPGLRFSVSYTTRAPRGSEQNGHDYFFVTREDFESRIAQGEFLEWAEVFGNYYGTHISELGRAANEGVDLVLDIDVQGARQLKSKLPAAVAIFILAPSRQILEQRLRKRATDAPAVMQKRLSVARQELSQWKNFDYLVISTSIAEDLRRTLAIVEAEKMRVTRSHAPTF